LIDDIINEPLIGAHRDRDTSAAAISEYFLTQVKELREMGKEKRMEDRYTRLTSVGAYSE
ncbi:MAG: acetyl-CoA carboxylase carboxyl transferase subunit alpha, partial [Sulfurimonas sp.]|nr:acetyl-CoA carboxylase carboxyl transferase subunit alpha [Sulfurimonas sp.]